MQEVNLICRIGSLENLYESRKDEVVSYLPHRQLRKDEELALVDLLTYLPHRQLRNLELHAGHRYLAYLPHRQLRNYLGAI